MKVLCGAIILALVHSSLQATDYCTANLCKTGVTHVGCNPPTTFAVSGGAFVTIDAAKKALILGEHNKLRNKIALGLEKNSAGVAYNTAAKMTTMQWDDELAYLASINARQCDMKHDACRNTVVYKYAGQNLASYGTTATSINVTAQIISMIGNWYNESANANPTLIDSYQSTTAVIGHFTQVVKDRADRVGCAISTWTVAPWNNLLLACNYALTNILGAPTYVKGTTASGCTTGKNAQFPGLCSPSEVVKYDALA
ncbi:antigen 5 like allergen Cul n 1-like [Uranotaenia lowii]|uniref:antigen 5 like allergen Cul n 1-like n=1 Tax=Uranotaenia lowii TaxID=190385 RepID=UPI00247843A0|nr:antigen 5 like allergen Cul n 1-like [Uranotaenia lowii]